MQTTIDLVPLRQVDGRELKNIFSASTAWLEKYTPYVNSLNVFPVPDGDSGTNMLLTMQSGMREVESVHSSSAGEMLAALAHGALLGARGNSGVILSQIIRGFAARVGKQETIDARDFSEAMREGSRTAYHGV